MPYKMRDYALVAMPVEEPDSMLAPVVFRTSKVRAIPVRFPSHLLQTGVLYNGQRQCDGLVRFAWSGVDR